MPTLPKVLINQADSKSAGGVALRVRTQEPALETVFGQCSTLPMPMTLQQLRSSSSRVWLRINCSNQCLLIIYLQPAASRNESPIIYLPLTKKGLWVNAHIEQFYDLWY